MHPKKGAEGFEEKASIGGRRRKVEESDVGVGVQIQKYARHLRVPSLVSAFEEKPRKFPPFVYRVHFLYDVAYSYFSHIAAARIDFLIHSPTFLRQNLATIFLRV